MLVKIDFDNKNNFSQFRRQLDAIGRNVLKLNLQEQQDSQVLYLIHYQLQYAIKVGELTLYLIDLFSDEGYIHNIP